MAEECHEECHGTCRTTYNHHISENVFVDNFSLPKCKDNIRETMNDLANKVCRFNARLTCRELSISFLLMQKQPHTLSGPI